MRAFLKFHKGIPVSGIRNRFDLDNPADRGEPSRHFLLTESFKLFEFVEVVCRKDDIFVKYVITLQLQSGL
jgi:hypothetical protein